MKQTVCEFFNRTPGRQQKSSLALGVAVSSLTPALAREHRVPDGKGAVVRAVKDCSPADLAGVKAGDVIRQFNGRPVENANALVSITKSAAATTAVTLGILRGGRSMNIHLALSNAPSSSARNASQTQNSSISAARNFATLIVPGARIGKISLGESFGQINDGMPRAVHGHCDANRSNGTLTGQLVCNYSNAGLQAEFYAPSISGRSDAGYDAFATGKAIGIQVSGIDRQAQAYVTSLGIRLDSSRRDVINAYGKPSREHEEKIGDVVDASGKSTNRFIGVDVLDYGKAGISFAVAGSKGSPDEVVTAIRIYRPGTKLDLAWDL
jgi:membrane-associated protease RseP (regulator of RpoE activity)